MKLAKLPQPTFQKFKTFCDLWKAGEIDGQTNNKVTVSIFSHMIGLKDNQIDELLQEMIEGHIM